MITISNDYALSLLEDRLETAIYNGLLKLYHDGYLDVSCEEFEEYGISFIEVVSDDETRILIRH